MARSPRRRSGGLADRLRSRLPRRPLPVVAVLGPDGAGKGTVIEGVRARAGMPVTAVYLGGRASRRKGAETPHGRYGGADHVRDSRQIRAVRPGAARECAFLLVRALRQLHVLLGGYAAAWRGSVVLCDRHPIEALALTPKRTRPGALLERFIAGHVMPWPDAVILLDAPAETLFARKGEHSVEVLERRRGAYLEAFAPRGARVVATDRSPDASLAEALAVLGEAIRARSRV